METIADILLVSGALAAGFYCFVLSRRLNALKSAEGGIGDAVSMLAAQVDDLNASVSEARKAAQSSSASLTQMTTRAESVAQRLELLVASMHDIRDPAAAEEGTGAPVFSSRSGRAPHS
ncbi:MAG: hypothetical protein AAF891_02650 [Pseudomonadota bacterium]